MKSVSHDIKFGRNSTTAVAEIISMAHANAVRLKTGFKAFNLPKKKYSKGSQASSLGKSKKTVSNGGVTGDSPNPSLEFDNLCQSTTTTL